MKALVFDLEMNQSSGKIIEVGYVIGETTTGVIYQEQSITTHSASTANCRNILKMTNKQREAK